MNKHSISSAPCAHAYGVFSIVSTGQRVAQAILDNPNVDGIAVRLGWSQLAPTADANGNPVYDWSYLDNELVRIGNAGKMITLRIGTDGGYLPDWVLSKIRDNRGTFFSFYDTNPNSIGVHTIPVFWNPTLLAAERRMLRAVGARYTGNPNIKLVNVQFAGARTMDWNVPASNVLSPEEQAAGFTTTEIERWLAAGYTTQKVIDSGCASGNAKGVIDNAITAFPNQAVGFAGSITRHGLDPLGTRYAAETAFENAKAKYGSRIEIQRHDLCQKTAVFQPFSGQPADNIWRIMYDKRPQISSQMTRGCRDPLFKEPGYTGTDADALKAAVNVGHDYGTRYQEIYPIDVGNPALAGVIEYAHNLLACPSSMPTTSG